MDPKKKPGEELPTDEKKGKSSKGYRRPKYSEKKSKTTFLDRGKNNILWRTGDKVLTDLVGNLPFGQPSGLPQTINVIADPSAVPANIDFVIPGIMSVRTLLTAGETTAQPYNDAKNLAFRKIYSFVRHANSGSKNYEAADLGLYLLSVGQVLGMLGWLQRLYAIVNQYSATNRYMPRYLIRQMGVDYDDIIANQAQLKYLIAWLGRAIGALAFPKLPYFDACYEAFKWIYRDNDSPKEQLYFLDAFKFGKYNPTHSSTGGGLEFIASGVNWCDPTSGTLTSFATLMNYVHSTVDVLLSDEDIGIISGDILKAYRDGELFVPVAFGDYDPIIKDEEALQQFHNAHVTDIYQVSSIEQVAGSTNQAPYLVNVDNNSGTFARNTGYSHHTFIDAFSKVPTSDEVVNCLVLNPQYTVKAGSSANTYVVDKIAFDLHLPVKCIMTIDTTGTIIDASPYIRRVNTSSTTPDIYRLSNFDWHPLIPHISPNVGTPTGGYFNGDLQNCRFFAFDVGARIHEAAMLNLLKYSEANFKG